MPWFPLPEFSPVPFLKSGHAQTIFGALWPSATNPDEPRVHRVDLEDGDRLVVFDDAPTGWNPGGRAVLLVHGLGGEVRKGPLERLTRLLVERGIRVFRMELRGVGAGMMDAKGWTHAGRSEDVASTLRAIEKWVPGSPLALVGLSMGGNQILKMLGEMGRKPFAQIRKAIAVAPPVCLHTCSGSISRGLNRIYDLNFVRSLNRQVQRRKKILGLKSSKGNRKPHRLRQFDQELTAPACGFANADEYYTRASSRPLLKEIEVPTLILVADDDPIVPIHSFNELDVSTNVELKVTRGGGHLGYLSTKVAAPDRRWLDWRLLEQLTFEPF